VAVAAPGVTPTSVSTTLTPGQSLVVNKAVETGPGASPKLDLYFLADTTGSMSGPINDVKTGAAAIITAVNAANPDSRYAAGDYKDFFDSPRFNPCTDFGATADNGAAATTCINGWSAFGGGDGPEGQFYAMHHLFGAGGSVHPRADASHVLVWFGDAPGHDPYCTAATGEAADINEASVIADLVAGGWKVLAISTTTGFPLGLDDNPQTGSPLPGCINGGTPGQATRIAAATGGLALANVSPSQVAETIISGLSQLPTTVTPSPSCDPGISATYDAASKTVTPGQTATFTETITNVSASAPGTYHCTVKFLINGGDAGPAFTQSVTVTVPGSTDTSPPSCALTNTGTQNGKKFVEVTVQDTGSGLGSVTVTHATNGTVTLPSFTPGTTSPQIVKMVKKNQSLTSTLELHVADVAGNAIDCDPSSVTLRLKARGGTVMQRLTRVPAAEHYLRLDNNRAGKSRVVVSVNGKRFKIVRLARGASVKLDLSRAMRAGRKNVVVIKASGVRRGQVTATLHD
jgi:hypothetical protein